MRVAFAPGLRFSGCGECGRIQDSRAEVNSGFSTGGPWSQKLEGWKVKTLENFPFLYLCCLFVSLSQTHRRRLQGIRGACRQASCDVSLGRSHSQVMSALVWGCQR